MVSYHATNVTTQQTETEEDMSKGIKMRSAKNRYGHPFGVEALQRLVDSGSSVPDLVCDDRTCSCAVRFVPRYQQYRSNRIEPIDIPAYIGLTRDSEHSSGCQYNASARLTAIAAQSDPEFLSALNKGKRELRLLALHNGLRKPGLSGIGPVAAGSRPEPSTGKGTMQIVRSNTKLDSYLRTTADLLALRALCESDDDLSDELVLRVGSKKIPWKQFFFERERFDAAWELVRRGGTDQYPIALVGVVKNHHHPNPTATYRSSFLNCYPWYRDTAVPDRVETFEVSVAHEDGPWLASFALDSEVALFGIWKASDSVERTVHDKRDPKRSVTYVTHKLTLSPVFGKQVVAIT